MRGILVILCAAFLLPVALAAADEDSLINDEDTVVGSGVNFDIPPEATRWPDGREKHYCATTTGYDEVCFSESTYYYLIKIQNWGDETAHEVRLVDIPDYGCGEYELGSAEMATQFDEKGTGIDWQPIPDTIYNVGDGYLVADTMAPCDRIAKTCVDTRLVRFKVVIPSGCPKSSWSNENSAVIKHAADSEGYVVNDGFGLNLRPGLCASENEPSKFACDGEFLNTECDEERPCPNGYNCDLASEMCIVDPLSWCETVTVSSDPPDKYSEEVMVPIGTNDLTVGKFKVKAGNCTVPEKAFIFESLDMFLEKDGQNLVLRNLSLMYDRNGNDTVDPEEEAVASIADLGYTGGILKLKKDKNAFTSDEEHHFIVHADVSYVSTTVPGGLFFRFVIENGFSFDFGAVGTVTLEREPMNFERFEIEPSNPYYFILTRGLNDPSVPEDVRQNIPLLQLRAKSPDGPDKILSIVVSTAGEEYATFGKNGIRALSLYLDTNGDGVPDGEPIATVTSFDDPTEVVFEGEAIESQLTFEQGEERFLIISGDLTDLPCGKTARLALKRGDVVTMDRSRPLFGLPVYSKEFGDLDDICTTPKDDGCGCALVW